MFCSRRRRPSRLALFVILAALPVSADTLDNVKAALAALRGTAPVSAGVELQTTNKSSGRFANQHTAASLTVEAVHDGSGLQVRLPQVMIERLAAEARENEADPNKPTPLRFAVGEVDAATLAVALNFGEFVARLLRRGQVVSESRVIFGGRQARFLVLKLTPKLPKEATGIFNVKFNQDRLNLWIGDDNIPLAAERSRKGTAGFLFLRGEMTSNEKWSFARHADRLVATRYEENFAGSGFGQRAEGKTVRTITIRQP